MVDWSSEPLLFNGEEQAPQYTMYLPPYANFLQFEYVLKAVNVGKYTTILSIKNDTKNNFMLNRNSVDFEIKVADVQVSWEGCEFTYNGEVQYPKFTFDKSFVESSDFSVNNDSINAGNYTATLTSKNSNINFVNNEFNYSINKYEIMLNWQDTILNYVGYPQKPIIMYQKLAFIKNIVGINSSI